MNKVVLNSLVIAALVVSAAFTSCDKDDDGLITVSGTLTGEYANWDVVIASFDYGETLAATVPPISGGKFSIELPVPKAKYLKPFIVGDFLDGITISDKNVKSVTAAFYVRINNYDYKLNLAARNNSQISFVFYIYCDRNCIINGSNSYVSDDKRTETHIYENVKYSKGWNVLSWTVIEPGVFYYKTGAIPSGATWMSNSQLYDFLDEE